MRPSFSKETDKLRSESNDLGNEGISLDGTKVF